MATNINLPGNGGTYSWNASHIDDCYQTIYVGWWVQLDHVYRGVLKIQNLNAGRRVRVKSATLNCFARAFSANNVRTTITLQIGTSGAWDATGTTVAVAQVAGLKSRTQLVFNDTGLRLLEEYLQNGTQFYVYFTAPGNIQGVQLTGYAPTVAEWQPYTPYLSIEYAFSGVKYGHEDEWQDCEIYLGVDGEWKPCEVYSGQDGAWKQC